MNNTDKVIWMLWMQGEEDAPEVVKACISSWRIRNPDWQVTVLTEKNLKRYINIDKTNFRDVFAAFTNAQKSDVIRLLLLHKYGGIWADATAYCALPLSQWIEAYTVTGFFAFDKPGRDRLMANWFLYADKGNYIIEKLLFAAARYWQNGTRTRFRFYTVDRVINFYPQLWFGNFLANVLKKVPYFWFHYLFENCCDSDWEFKEEWENTVKLPAKAAISPQVIGLFKTLDNPNEFIDTLRTASPVFKLTWKYDFNEEVEGRLINQFLKGRV